MLVAVLVVAGLGIPRVHAQGAVFSSAVDPDGGAQYRNPAAIALVDNGRIDVVANTRILGATYTRAGIDPQTGQPFLPVSVVAPRPEPVVDAVIDPIGDSRWRLGVNSTIPNAAGAAWPEYQTVNGQQILGPTRYHVVSTTIFHVMTQFGASFRVSPTFAIGATANLVNSSASVYKHVDLGNQSPIRDTLPCADNPLGCENASLSAPVTLKGSGLAFGGSVGVLWMPTPHVRIGAGYVAPVRVPLDITTSIDTTKLEDFARMFLPAYGTLGVNGSGHASLLVPQRLHIAVAVEVTPRWELTGDLRWTDYSATETITGTLTQRNSDLLPDALTIAAPSNNEWFATLRVASHGNSRYRIAGSLSYTTSTVPDAFMCPANLDFKIATASVSGQIRVSPHVLLGATLAHSYLWSRTITESAWGDDAPEPYNYPSGAGTYRGFAERVGIDMTYLF